MVKGRAQEYLPLSPPSIPFHLPSGVIVRVLTLCLPIVAAAQQPVRPIPRPPAPPPSQWVGLFGEYGLLTDSAAILFVFERGGKLLLRAPAGDTSTLEPVSDTEFTAAARAGRRYVFHREPDGHAVALLIGDVRAPRRNVGPERGQQLRLTPVRPVAELLVEDRNATPPAESGSFRKPELVELASLDSTIHYEIRYATTNDFLGSAFYSSAHAFMQRPAARALLRAHRKLRALGYGLLIHDAYRPWYVTKVFWDATPPDRHWLVANPDRGSKHNRGCAVDLTLYDLRTGAPLDMGGTYDEATPRSAVDYPVATEEQWWRRELLRRVMEDEGFSRNPSEWWHFDYKDWRSYPILNLTFEALSR
jgi:D-alanyl-D-alanine dipeptidase